MQNCSFKCWKCPPFTAIQFDAHKRFHRKAATFKVRRLQFGLWTHQPLFFTPVSVQPWLLIYAGGASFLNQTVYTILHPHISTGKRLNQTIPGNKAPRFMFGWTACVLICSLFLQKSLQRQLSTLFFCHVSYIKTKQMRRGKVFFLL